MLRSFISALLLLAGAPPLLAQQPGASGFVRDATDREALYGAIVRRLDRPQQTVTNAYGFFSLPLAEAAGEVVLTVSYLGYRSDTLTWRAGAEGRDLEVLLLPVDQNLTTVEVSAARDWGGAAGAVRIDNRLTAEAPVLLGEKDPLKTLELLPGVARPREGFGGLFVRGGSPDQNLILLDGAPVYNASHLFGLLSVFNPDAVASVDLYRGDFPARFGGRVASVIDVRTREGSRDGDWHGRGGIGLLTARLTLEGPLGRGRRGSFLVSGRRSYADLLLRLVTPPGERYLVGFWDGSLKANYTLGRRDRIYLSSYHGRDNFGNVSTRRDLEQRDAFDWGNRTLSLRWNHRFADRAFLNLTALRSTYDFSTTNEEIVRDTVYALSYRSGVADYGLRADLDYAPHPDHQLKFGGVLTTHRFDLGTTARGGTSLTTAARVPATELALYAEDEWAPSDRWTLLLGLRLARFAPDTTAAFTSLEPRLSIRFAASERLRLRAAYAATRQYLQLLSNSGPGLPTSLWVPAGNGLRPQRGHHFSLEADWTPAPVSPLRLAVGTYYRRARDLIGYTNGATFLLLDALDGSERVARLDILDNVTQGDGHAYGLELSGSYRTPALRLRAAYTLGRAVHRLSGVNDFNYFPAAHDRRHDLTLSVNWDFAPRFTLSANWTYGSGLPTTLPRAGYGSPNLPGFGNRTQILSYYGSRNNFRLPPLHRLDAGLRWRRSPRWGEAHWELSVYNAYARANPFYLRAELGNRSGNGALFQRALFPLLPSLSYGFKF